MKFYSVRRNSALPIIMGLLLLCAAMAGVLAHPAEVFAHAKLVSATPADGTSVPSGLTTIVLLFSEDVSVDQSTARVIPSGAQKLVNTTTSVDKANRTKLTITTAPLPDGQYEVRWHVLTENDNATTDGVVNFRVGAGPPVLTATPEGLVVQPAATPPVAATPGTGQTSGLLLLTVLVLAIAVVAGLFFWRRRV